jgi:hypothetical protein
MVVSLLVLVLSLSACAAGPNKLIDKEAPGGEVAGFWQGLWHGFISPFTFIISLFNKNINIYEVYNNGNWYNFGFMFGVSMILGGGGSRACRKSK